MPDPGVREEPKGPGFEEQRTQVTPSLTDRELYDKLLAARGKPVNVYDDSTGRTRTFQLGGRRTQPNTRRIRLDMRPTPVPPDQLAKAYQDAAGFFQQIETDHPILSDALLNNPQLLPLLPEINMMLNGGGDIATNVTAALLDAMPNAVGYHSYANTMYETPVQQMLWTDVISKFDSGAKDVVTYLLSELTERGADRVSSLAFAWLRENPMETREDQGELLFRMQNWASAEQQTELHDKGFPGLLDKPQEFVENLVEIAVTNPLVSGLGSPEEAIRRSGATLGQQVAWQFGFNPDEAGWSWTSGIVDAVGEVVLDPVSWAAGVGAGVKAAKTLPLSVQAVQKGRLGLIARSATPFLGRTQGSVARGVLQTRSLSARTTYAFKAKTFDGLLDSFAKSKAGRNAFDLLQQGNTARFLQRFPSLERAGATFFDTMRAVDPKTGEYLVKSPEEMIEVIKYTMWTDNMDDPSETTRAMKELSEARRALENSKVGRHQQDLGVPAPVVDTRALQLDVLKAQMRLDNIHAKQSQVFVIDAVPKRQRSLYGLAEKVTNGREGHIANTVRRWTADLSQGFAGQFDIYNTRTAVQHLRGLLNHYGVGGKKTDDLINKFMELDIGERQSFLLHKMIPVIGDATGNPMLRYGMVEIYRRSDGVRSFAPNFDEAVNAAGDTVNRPILPSNLQNMFMFPVNEVDQIISRYNKAGTLRALSLGKRGLVQGFTDFTTKKTPVGTITRRQNIVNRLRDKATQQGYEGLEDEDLYQMAYAWMGKDVDPRGWVSKTVNSFNTQILKPFETAFKKGMLGTRFGQWMFKVTILEEGMRGHVFEMPNMYSKPFSFANNIFSNHYLNKTEEWTLKQHRWVDAVREQTLAGSKTVEQAEAAIRANFGKAADDILGDKTFSSVAKLEQRLGSWLHKASLDRAQMRNIPDVSLSRRIRAWKVNHAEDIRQKEHLGAGFRPDEIEDINGRALMMYFGDELATSKSGTRIFEWSDQMSGTARQSYGEAWGSKVQELTTDPAAQWALRRMVAQAKGEDLPAALSAASFIETSSFSKMKGIIREFFPDEVDDVARVERYLNERVAGWAEHLLQPVLSQGGINRAEFLENLIQNRQFIANVNNHKYDIDLRHVGSAKRQLGSLVEDQSQFAATTPFPEKIASVPVDWRFLDNSEKGKLDPRYWLNAAIKFGGETSTQVWNRRPAWRQQHKKWYGIYRDRFGMPEALARSLAEEKATQIVNHVFYDISEAPTMVKKLNEVIPFFGAMYEVAQTWAYKMPVAAGGYWPLGAGEFGRKMDRMMRAMISTGLVAVTEEDGKMNYTMQLRPEPDLGTPLGNALSEIGYHIWRTPGNAIAQIFALAGNDTLKEGLALSGGGFDISVGNPLNPLDFGVLSFAQLHVGLNPAMNFLASTLAGRFFPAADVQKIESGDSPTTLAELADRLEVEVDDLARANRKLIPKESYAGLFSDDVDPADVVIAAGSQVIIPGSSLIDSIIDEGLFAYGKIETPSGILRGMAPAMWQHVLRGWGLAGTPSDEAWAGDLNHVPFFGGQADMAAVNGQLLEAFMHLESSEGTFTEIFELQDRYERLKKKGGGEEADEVLDEINRLSGEAIKRSIDMASGAMILRGLGGGFFPTTGRAVRAEAEQVNEYWSSREWAEQLKGTDAQGRPLLTASLGRVKNIEDIDQFFQQVSKWLEDDTGDASRMWVRQHHPGIFAFLQPKTFWGAPGEPPEIASYEDYLEQIESGERKPAPLGVTVQRHLRSGVEADYWTEFVGMFGNDPEEAAAGVMDNIHIFDEMQDRRFRKHDALDMMDDAHGHVYLDWLNERGKNIGDEYESVEAARDQQREYMDTLSELLDFDLEPHMEANEIREFRTHIKTAMAELQDMSEKQAYNPEGKNPYELAMREYWDIVYAEFNDSIDPIWDRIGNSRDSEEKSLLFEELKIEMNEWAQTRRTLFGRTDISFPSPLDVKWNRKTEDEQKAWVQRRATLPLEWLNLDDVERILQHAPADAGRYFPTTREAMDVYTQWTRKKNEIDEWKENGEITESERRDLQDEAEDRVRSYLLENGRDGEVVYMDMWPIEQLYVTGQLPPALEYLMPEVRYAKEAAAAEGRKQPRDEILLPIYTSIKNRALTDPAFGDMLADLGLTLFDESDYDAIGPKLILGGFESDF